MRSFTMTICIVAGLIFPYALSAQQIQIKQQATTKKGFLYFGFGSNRIFYTPSTIHVKRGGSSPLDFTLDKVKGRDEGGLKWETAPQFSYAVGYYFVKKNFGLEYHYDHVKYFVKQNQVVHMKGTVQGNNYDKDTLIHPGFFMLEHSDGANYAMFNFVKWFPLYQPLNTKFSMTWLCMAGLGFVNPKTNSTISGQYRDDKYHLSGYIVGLESGLRLNFGSHFFATGTFKGAYANYSDFLIANGKGSQQWFSGQFNYMIGSKFPL